MASSGPRSKPLKTVTWARGDSVNEVDEEPTQQGPDLTQGDQDCSQEDQECTQDDQECTQEDQECTQEDQDCTQEGRDVSREVLEQKRLQRLQKAGIKVLPAAVRYSRSGPKGMRRMWRMGLSFVITECPNSLVLEVLTAPIVALVVGVARCLLTRWYHFNVIVHGLSIYDHLTFEVSFKISFWL